MCYSVSQYCLIKDQFIDITRLILKQTRPCPDYCTLCFEISQDTCRMDLPCKTPITHHNTSIINVPSLESDWLISGQRRRALGCSPGLSCVFVDWWRRLFLLETHRFLLSMSLLKHRSLLGLTRGGTLTPTCVTSLATDFCKRSA